jgi:hypothetical protein
MHHGIGFRAIHKIAFQQKLHIRHGEEKRDR